MTASTTTTTKRHHLNKLLWKRTISYSQNVIGYITWLICWWPWKFTYLPNHWMNYAASDCCRTKFIGQIHCWHKQSYIGFHGVVIICSTGELGSPSLQRGSRALWSQWKGPLTSRDFGSYLVYHVFCQQMSKLYCRSPCTNVFSVVTRTDLGVGLKMHP